MKKAVFLLCSALLSSHAAFAMNTQGVDEQDVEVIEIIGQFSVAQWSKIADQAKVDFYDTFNEYNTIEKFRMVCRLEKPMGSNIKRNVCEPMFFKHQMHNETQNTIGNASSRGGQLMNLENPARKDRAVYMTNKTQKEADAHMEKLISEHPELRKKFEFYAKAKKASEIRLEMEKK